MRDFDRIERRLPGRGETKVVVAVAVPVVVDVETLGVEVADDDVIAVRVQKFCPLLSMTRLYAAPDIEVYRRSYLAFLISS